MKTIKVILPALLSFFLAGAVFAQNAPEAMKKEQCLACHGPTFDELIKKNVQAQSDSGPVNPHVWIHMPEAWKKQQRNALTVMLSIRYPRNRDTRIPVHLLNLVTPVTIIIN